MRQYREYSDEDVIKNSKEVKSMSGLIKSLGLKCAGGNFAHMKKTLQRLEVDTEHWTGQAWNKHEQLKDWKDYSKTSSVKKHLIKKRGHECENCHRVEWEGFEIALEVHHLNGDRTNNNESNLQLICPNCHSLTKNWRGRVS